MVSLILSHLPPSCIQPSFIARSFVALILVNHSKTILEEGLDYLKFFHLSISLDIKGCNKMCVLYWLELHMLLDIHLCNNTFTQMSPVGL